jgi:hypothetical protein
MNQTWIFVIAIGIVGIVSASFYLYRYSSMNENNRTLQLEGNFTDPLSMKEVISLVSSLKIDNISKNSIQGNESNDSHSIGSLDKVVKENHTSIMDFDRNLIDTLSKMVISALERSNVSSQGTNSSQSLLLGGGIEDYIISGQWNASITGKKMANISGVLNIRNLVDSNSKNYSIRLDSNQKGIEYVNAGDNMTIIIRGSAQITTGTVKSNVQTVFVFYKMKDVYLIAFESENPALKKLFVYGKISKISH